MSEKNLRIIPSYRYISLKVKLELTAAELDSFYLALEHATVFGQNPPGCSVSKKDGLWLRAGSTNLIIIENAIIITGLPPIKANIPRMN